MPAPTPAAVDAPATLGNFGPGFDAFSLALHGLGDRLELAPADEDRLTLTGPGAAGVPTGWTENTATRTLDALRAATGRETPLALTLTKGQVPGSGLGSSASSAGGAALAFARLHPEGGLKPVDLVRAAGASEGGGDPHYDDVAGVVLGGLAVVRPGPGGPFLVRVQPPEDLHIALAIPRLELLTSRMREVLPSSVPRADAVAALAASAQLVAACHAGDVRGIGACLEDRIATPARRPLVPFLDAAVKAGREAGAYGVSLAGSGPTVFAVTDEEALAQDVAEAMAEAIRGFELEVRAITARPEREVMHAGAPVR